MFPDPRTLYQRTTCNCPECSRWCRKMPGNLIPGDADRMAKHLGVTVAGLTNALLASPGATVGDQSTGRTWRIGTIVPARKQDGSCVFLDKDGLCVVHPTAPYACAYFDEHMPKQEADRRSLAGLRFIASRPDYEMQRLLILGRGRVAPAPETLREPRRER